MKYSFLYKNNKLSFYHLGDPKKAFAFKSES